MGTYKKPLGRSIAIGCVLFTAILCLSLSVLNYYNERNALYYRYQSQISDILHYVDGYIDDADLVRCIETGEESDAYRKTLRLMDEMMNTFTIHYLYAIKPINLNPTGNVMSVLSAEDDYNRYVDTEGNLYLGWISEDEYDAETVAQLYAIMEQDQIVFFVEKTGWSTDYTGALPLRDESGEAYALLCADVDITELSHELWLSAMRNTAVIMCLGLLYTVAFLLWTRVNITHPVKLLEQGVVDFAGRSHGQRDVDALRFEAPVIRSDNEVKSLSQAITQMTVDMQEYVSDILSAEERTRDMKELADAMSELAIVDSLTGVRNKTAYLTEEHKLNQELENNRNTLFGLAMIDLNYLKYINDNFGHEKGDEALKKLAHIICTVYARSPVFRVGGDEFIVLLRGQDYLSADMLKKRFLAQTSWRMDKEPWNHISAAIGVAFYDKLIDRDVDDVLKRADQSMYEMKKEMKAVREV